MSKVKTTTKFDITAALDQFMDQKTTDDIGLKVNEAVQDLLSKGISPVRGERRFEGYKNPDSYPGGKKPKRPVNLYLTGEMRNWLRYRKKDEKTIEYGFLEGTPQDILARANKHQDGDPNTAARPMLPTQSEQWAVSIIRLLKDLYSARLKDIIKKSNQ